jgi:N-methylhydantoinase A
MLMQRYVGIDTGGTFTDYVEIDEQGNIHFDKAFSTPRQPEQGIFDVLTQVAETKGTNMTEFMSSIERFAHGSTVSTNALIERKGAMVGLITTRGFEDTLTIARGPIGRTGGLPYLQAMDFINTEVPEPLVPKSLIRGIRERIAANGEVVTPIQQEDVEQAIESLLEEGVESIAVCMMWSFANPKHEELVKEIANRMAPHIPLSISSEISPGMGEFERMVTTVINAYIGPVMDRYILSLASQLENEGFCNRLQIIKSSGGLVMPEGIKKQAVSTINSGPTGGLVAARFVGKQLGYNNIITADMGGTSFDVGLIVEGEFEEDRKPYLDQGLPVQIPAIKLITIGAGGGSIAWTDGHRLMVGPESAGSDPGPVCYGLGGTEPTVTDALVTLGIIEPTAFFGGRKTLNKELSLEAIRTRIAEPLGLDVMEAAAGIYEVVNAKMGDLIRKVTVESGHDPRDFCLLAYGGATAAHCHSFAKQLGIKVVIPYTGPVFSAYGIALSDIVYAHSKSVPVTLEGTEECINSVNQTFKEIKELALQDLDRDQTMENDFQLNFKIDLRYQGQMNEVSINWPQGYLQPGDVSEVYQAFEALYERRFGKGTTRKETPMELINFRVEVSKITKKPKQSKVFEHTTSKQIVLKGTRQIYVHNEGLVEADIYDFGQLVPYQDIQGPAVIERPDTTIWVSPGSASYVDEYGNVTIYSGGMTE